MSPRHAYALVALTLAVACRQEPIREPIYTGERRLPSRPDAGTVTPTISVDAGVLTEDFSKGALTRAIGSCTTGLVTDFVARASSLEAAVRSYAAAPDVHTRGLAQAAWREAMGVWQELEVFRFGPAGGPELPGGLSLRDQVYAWPLVSACKIDEQLVERTYGESTFGASLINGRGLGALERLLFVDDDANGCSEFSVINASGSWDALGTAGRARHRLEYAVVVAALVRARASELEVAWREHAVAFVAGTTPYDSTQGALNAVSNAMFYVEKEVKDYKLGRPLGLLECASPPCLELVESPWAHASTTHLAANLRGFRRLYLGCDASGLGFDDWLVAVGAGELADRIYSALAQSVAVVDRLGGPIDALLVGDSAAVSAAYATVKSLTDPLKTELVTVLDLELPMTVEGDND